MEAIAGERAYAAEQQRLSPRPSGVADEIHAECIAAVMEDCPTRVRRIRGHGSVHPLRPSALHKGGVRD